MQNVWGGAGHQAARRSLVQDGKRIKQSLQRCTTEKANTKHPWRQPGGALCHLLWGQGGTQSSAVGAGAAEALPVPPNRSEILPWLSLTAHRAPFHPGVPCNVPLGTQGCHQGCPEHPWAVFSLAAVTVPLKCALEGSAVAGSCSSLLMAVPLSLLPGNRAGQDFPLLMHSLLWWLGRPLTSCPAAGCV